MVFLMFDTSILDIILIMLDKQSNFQRERKENEFHAIGITMVR